MSDNNLNPEELSKLEEQAYFELCQIIAEAMQSQDVELLDARIAAWKQKYKKLLDGSLPNSKFKKKIEFLLNQYYSSVTRYIQQQIKFKEHVKIENQAKALRKLYSIIKDTNDLKTLKKKVKEWENKYPYESFLKMYQKRISQITRESNLKDYAFDQDKAFSDLVAITKLNRTFDEYKYELEQWEKKYSINNKYKLDDFLNNRNEVKRYTTDEYLLSISRDNNTDDKTDDIDEKTGYTNINKQAAAYAALLSISSKPNNEAKMFEWVYKNRNIKFNENYKELILAATYLDYSPKLLNRIKIPNANLANSSVSLEEYNNINKLKKYSVVSYFNLLLPTESRITNDYFNEQLLEIYNKSEKTKHKNSFKVETPSSKIEIEAPEKKEPKEEDKQINLVDNKENSIEINVDESIINNENTVEIKLDNPVPIVKNEIEEEKAVDEPIEEINQEKNTEEPTVKIELKKEAVQEEIVEQTTIEQEPEEVVVQEETFEAPIIEQVPEEVIVQEETIEQAVVKAEPEEEVVQEKVIKEPIVRQEPEEEVIQEEAVEEPIVEQKPVKEVVQEETIEQTVVKVEPKEEVVQEKTVEEPVNETKPVEIVSISPMFFEAVHRHTIQSEIIGKVDETADEFIEKDFDEDTIDMDMDMGLQITKIGE